MILVDDREGSKQLVPSLVKAGLPAVLDRLDYGDLYWVGRGQHGKPVSIAVEFKTVGECISSLRTGRLQGHQLLGMRGAAPDEPTLYDFCYLLIEGELLYDANGRLLRRSGVRSAKPLGMTIGEFYKRLHVLHLCGGLNWHVVANRRDTIQWLSSLYHVWTDTDLDKHKSHLAAYVPPSLVPLSQFRRTVGSLPGVGARVSQAAERAFGSVDKAITATVDAWADLETTDDEGKKRRLGNSVANKIKEAIHGN